MTYVKRSKDLTMFNKLSGEEQKEQIRKFIRTMPVEEQAKARKELLDEK